MAETIAPVRVDQIKVPYDLTGANEGGFLVRAKGRWIVASPMSSIDSPEEKKPFAIHYILWGEGPVGPVVLEDEWYVQLVVSDGKTFIRKQWVNLENICTFVNEHDEEAAEFWRAEVRKDLEKEKSKMRIAADK
jgi:hypothetical protein